MKRIIIFDDGSSGTAITLKTGIQIAEKLDEKIEFLHILYGKESEGDPKFLNGFTSDDENLEEITRKADTFNEAIEIIKKHGGSSSLLLLPGTINRQSFSPFSGPIKSILEKIDIPVIFLNDKFNLKNTVRVAIIEDLIDTKMEGVFEDWGGVFFDDTEIHFVFNKRNRYQNDKAILKKMKELSSRYRIEPEQIHILAFLEFGELIAHLNSNYKIDLFVLKNNRKDLLTKIFEGDENRRIIKKKTYNVMTEKV